MIQFKTIVFIQGLFQNQSGWATWKTCFELAAYTFYSSAYLFHQEDPTEVRENSNLILGTLSLREITDRLTAFINILLEKSLLIEYSMSNL